MDREKGESKRLNQSFKKSAMRFIFDPDDGDMEGQEVVRGIAVFHPKIKNQLSSSYL